MPAYNEEANVEPVAEAALEAVSPFAKDLEIIVVDDGSQDATAAKIQALSAKYPAIVRLVQHARNQGYGAALYSGFTAAQKEWVFLTDSDRQFDLREICKLLPHLAEADLIVGYRAKRQDPAIRRLNGWGWNFIV
jgi:glycosyltransferase involved in cell wall biosynthesis